MKYLLLAGWLCLTILTINHYSRDLIWEPLFGIWLMWSVFSFIIHRLETSKF